ncbi:calcium-binding protein [Pseudonocardia acidicola]|uniref:calcium-binding protein n=1 Tax=Pseudonocardia acidicola TaxID=2724939 RepID=UPI001B7CDEE6
MNTRTAFAILAAALATAGAGAFVAISGSTLASFSDTVTSTPTTIGAATVVLGRDGKGPDLRYDTLKPGSPQTVKLTVDYQGTVPADVSLSITPTDKKGGSTFCQQKNGSWQARPGAALLITVGDAGTVSYCSLYNGTRMPLRAGVQPGAKVEVPVTVALAADARSAFDMSQEDGVTVYADGGFTDQATGKITVTTAGKRGGDDRSSFLAASPALVAAAPGTTPGAIAPDATDPGAAARTASAATPIELPAECAEAGMKPDDFAEVITVDPTHRSWNAAVERGAGAGPFLILGTAGDDTIAGSGAADCILGGAGRDTISGGTGNDVIIGGPGDDVLRGEQGDDRLYGGPGRDELQGGDGTDRFDGGADSATCDPVAGERAVRCTPPPPAAPASPAPSAPAPVPSPAPAPAPAPQSTPEPAAPSAPPSDAVVAPPAGPSTAPAESPTPEPVRTEPAAPSTATGAPA